MTPHQIERLKRQYWREGDVQALLAEWEERGREIERLRASTLPDVVPEDADALKAEIERSHKAILALTGEIERLKQSERALEFERQSGDALLKRAEQAEARLAKVVEAFQTFVDAVAAEGWCQECGVGQERSEPLIAARAALAAAQPKEER